MGICYELINEIKKEKVTFIHMSGSKFSELLTNHPQCAVTTLYLLKNQGDQIRFISDHDSEWTSKTQSYKDVTQDYIDELIKLGFFSQEGYLYQDEDEPDTIYELDLRCCW